MPDPQDLPDHPDALFAPAPPEPLNRKERAAVIARIEALMEYWGITPDELEGDPAPTEAANRPRPVKYRHPASGETWDGSGPHPEWLRRALLQEGLRVDELRPQADTAAPPEAPDRAAGD